MVGRLVCATATNPNVAPGWNREPRDRFVLQVSTPLPATNGKARTHETVTRTGPETTMKPEENRPTNTERQPQTRRSVRLPAPEEPARHTVPRQRHVPDPARSTMKDSLLRVAERMVGGWAPTLRAAALRVVLFTLVLIAVGIAFGGGIALLGVALGVVMFLVGRHRAGAAG